MAGLLLQTLIAFLAALIVRRREAFKFRWRPTVHTWAAVAAGLAAFGLSASLLLFSQDAPTAKFITFVLIWAACGFAAPWGYTLLIEKGRPADMGLTRKNWRASLALNVGLGGLLIGLLFFLAEVRAIEPGLFWRGAFVLLVGGLFELFLYYGFIHLRLEKAFGTVPAILVTAAVYVLWHVGTQLPLEADPWAAVFKLWLVGVFYQSVFSLTRNLLTIWPFFMGGGVLLDFVVHLQDLKPVAGEVGWAALTVGLMAACGLALAWLVRRRGLQAQPVEASHF